MTQDPIVAEVRAIREQMFKECDYDLGKLVRYLRTQTRKRGMKSSPAASRPLVGGRRGKASR